MGGRGRRDRGPLQERSLVGGRCSYVDRLLQEGHRLVVGTQGCCPFRGCRERNPGLACQRVGLLAFRGVGMRREIVPRESASQFVRTQSLEKTGSGQVPHLPVAFRERVVSNLADQSLDEGELPAFRAPRIRLEGEQLAAGKASEPGFELGLGDARNRAQAGRGEGLPEHGCVLDQGSVGRVEGIEACGDQRRQRLGNREAAKVPGRYVRISLEGETPLGDEHPHGLDRVQRDSAGTLDYRPDGGFRESGDKAREEFAHCRFRQWLQVDRDEIAFAGAPVRPLLQQLGPCQRDDIDRKSPTPVQEVIDEVEQAGVGEMQVFEDHHHRRLGGQTLEERPPRREQLLRPGPRLEAEQRQQRRLDPGALVCVWDVLGERLCHLRSRRGFVVGLEQAAPAADHLAKGPEADAFAVCRRSAVVPPDVFDEAVDVLQEFPGQPALADAGGPDDGHQPEAAFATGRVEQVLEHAQLVVAADERRLDGVAPVAAAAFCHDAHCAPGRHGAGLALQDLVADRLEGNRLGRRALRSLADQDSPGGCH